MATEWLDPMDYISELENEKENLLLEVEELTRKNKSLIEYIEKQDLKNAQDVVDERDDCLKEIETLRHNLEAASRETSRLSTELIECKRRAMIYIEAMEHSDPKLWVSDWHPEAAEWFE